MLILGPHFREHRSWLVTFAGGTAVSVAAFVGVGWMQDGWPGGGSWLGLTYGVVAFLIFGFECLLAWRKWSRRRVFVIGTPRVREFVIPAGSARWWMRAHIWLGLLCVPLVVLHAGGLKVTGLWPPLAGGWLTSALLVVFFTVIASGVWGVVLQNRLPRQITREVPEETIARQVNEVMQLHVEQLARLIDDVCGLPDRGDLATAAVGYRTPGASQTGRVSGKTEVIRPPAELVPGAEPLRRFFLDHARVYLLGGLASGSSLASPTDAAARFRRLRADVPPDAWPAVVELEKLCARRRELDRQTALDDRLQRWRWAHVPLSALLIALTVAHVLTAIRYR